MHKTGPEFDFCMLNPFSAPITSTLRAQQNSLQKRTLALREKVASICVRVDVHSYVLFIDSSYYLHFDISCTHTDIFKLNFISTANMHN